MLGRTLVLAATAVFVCAHAMPALAQGSSVLQLYQELFAASQKDKRGLTFHVNGQTIPGVVTKVIGNEAVEVRSQTHNRVIIRLDRIDAISAY